MADTNRLELDIVAVDETEKATTKAKANFRSVEQEATRAAAGMTGAFDAQTVRMARSIETASNVAMRNLERLEKRAELAGKSPLQKLDIQRDTLIKNLGGDEAAIQRAVTATNSLRAARLAYDEVRRKGQAEEEHGHAGVLRRVTLGIKDYLEGRTQGTIIQATDILIGTSAGGGILKGSIGSISAIVGVSSSAVIAVASVAAAIVGLEVAGVAAMHSLAKQGEEFRNTALRTGLSVESVQAFEYAAKASGQKPEIIEKLTRGLADTASDTSPAGKRGRQELERLGVNFRDEFGDLKPTQQLLLDVGDAINKLPPGLQRSAASMEIFKRVGVEAVPFLLSLRENLERSGELGKTFDSADAELAEKYHKTFTDLGEQWNRLKLQIQVPLAIFATVNLKGLSEIKKDLQLLLYDIPDVGERIVRAAIGKGDAPPERALYAIDKTGAKHYIGPPSAELAEKRIERLDADDKIRALKASAGFTGQLDEAKKKLAELPVPEIGVTKSAAVDEYKAARDRVKQLEDAVKASTAGAEAVLASRKERSQLESQYTEIQESAKLKEINIGLGKNELAGPGEIVGLLQLADARVRRDQGRALEDRRYRVGENGRVEDLAGTAGYQAFAREEAANLPLRLRNEYAKVVQEISDHDQKYFQSRTDADGKAWEEAVQRRRKYELDAQDEVSHQYAIQRDRKFDIDSSSNDRQRDLALQRLGIVDAQSLREKSALEDQKLAIEEFYAARSIDIQVRKLTTERDVAIGEAQRKAYAAGFTPGSEQYDHAGDAIAATYGQQIDAARQTAHDKDIIDAQRTANEKAKLQIESTKSVYQNLKQEANGLFDALFTKTKSLADFGKELFKTAILTPIKDIFSSQTAGLFTELLTGQKVSFGEVGTGQGAFGKLGSLAGRAGLGTPRFGQPHELSNLNQPNHLGDLSLVSGAVPVVITNSTQVAQAHAQTSSFSLAPVIAGLSGLAAATGAAASTGSRALQSVVSSALVTDPSQFGEPGLNTGTFSSLGGLLGGPGGTSGFAGPVGGEGAPGGGLLGGLFGGGQSGGGGILGRILGGGSGGGGGFLGGLKGLLGQNVAGTDIGGGIGIANSGLLGHLAAFGKSGGAALLGGIAALDGIRRGGVKGTIEAAGGGALVGFKFGGPVGAAIGAGIGAGAALIKTFFFKSDRDHAKELVKKIYGVAINDATADQIVQIAKQSYGGQIDMAVRSPQVRELIGLFSQATGQGNIGVGDKSHGASLIESGGRLSQEARYINGQAYSYSSPLSVYGGLQTSPLPTAPPGNVTISSVQLHVGDGGASDLFDGRIAQTVNPGYVQAQFGAAQSSSNGRLANSAIMQQPGLVTS